MMTRLPPYKGGEKLVLPMASAAICMWAILSSASRDVLDLRPQPYADYRHTQVPREVHIEQMATILENQVGNWYGMFLHESQYMEPVMRDIEAMLQSSQRHVNGTVTLQLRPLSFSTIGVDSPDDLVKTKFGEYGEMSKGWTADDAKGFIKVTSTPLRVFYANHKDEAENI